MEWKDLTAPNVGLLVYKRLYTEREILFQEDGSSRIVYDSEKKQLEIFVKKDAKTTPFDPFYKAIFDKTLADFQQIENEAANCRFNLQTTYPGLLCGSGYTHDSNAKGDIKVGFYFDHTTGQPVIPGSSIKGVIKSIFENENDKTDESSLAALKFIVEGIMVECSNNEQKKLWEEILDYFVKSKNIKALEKLKEQIFGKQDTEGNDVFYDAVINIEKTGTNKKFLANDFITPHPDPLKNPTPLMFIKVLPKITFEFRFKLTDSEIEIKINEKPEKLIVSKEQKKSIFRQIILTLGLGAKTNVGYGQFILTDYIPSNDKSEMEKGKKQTENNPIQIQGNSFPRIAIDNLTKGIIYSGIVVQRIENMYEISFSVNKAACKLVVPVEALGENMKLKKVNVELISEFNPDGSCFSVKLI